MPLLPQLNCQRASKPSRVLRKQASLSNGQGTHSQPRTFPPRNASPVHSLFPCPTKGNSKYSDASKSCQRAKPHTSNIFFARQEDPVAHLKARRIISATRRVSSEPNCRPSDSRPRDVASASTSPGTPHQQGVREAVRVHRRHELAQIAPKRKKTALPEALRLVAPRGAQCLRMFRLVTKSGRLRSVTLPSAYRSPVFCQEADP